jgi:DNA-binding CsgD family transcriptional regulator
MRISLDIVGTQNARQQLVGRTAEVKALGTVLDQVAFGRSAILLLEGEAGIGKTRLLEYALDVARQRGIQVVSGRAQELERNRPFGLLSSAFGCRASAADPRRAAIATMMVVPGEAGASTITVTSDPGLQFRVVDAFRDLADELAASRPLIVGVDDLQWADPSSLLTLAGIGGNSTSPLGVIGCVRPTPRASELDRLLAAWEAAGAQRVAVGPLGEGAVRELVTQLIGTEPGPQLLREVTGTAGNPLYIAELLAALSEEHAIWLKNGRSELVHHSLPPNLRLTILRRLSFLPTRTVELLQTASILGSTFSLTDLATVTGRPALELSGAFGEAIKAGVLGDDGEQLRFRHDLIRDAIYADLPPSMLRGLHREAGHRLAESGASLVQVAEHLFRGATPGDSEAIGWLARAARDVVSRSPDSAAVLLERAITMSDPHKPGHDGLALERAGALVLAGKVSMAIEQCQELLSHDLDPALEGLVRICLGHALLGAGRSRQAVAELAAATQTPGLPDGQQATALGWQSVAQIWLADLAGAERSAEQARVAAEQAGDEPVHAIATTMLAVVARLRGRPADALTLSQEALRCADRSPARQGHRFPVSAQLAYTLFELDRFAEARAVIERGLQISDELGTTRHLTSYDMVRAVGHYTAGEWDQAIADVEASLHLAGATGQAYGIIIGLSVLATIHLHRNDLRRARERITTASRLAEDGEDRFGAQRALATQALILEAEGHLEEAYVALTQAWDECTRVGLTSEYRVLGPDLVRLAIATEHRPLARDIAAAVTALAAHNDVLTLTAVAQRCRGLAADDTDILAEAAALAGRGARPFEHALACEDAGTAFLRRGELVRARQLLEQAVETYEGLAAARCVARVNALLRDAGLRRGPRTPRRRPQTGWASLTDTERAVAALVGEGLSNPQIGKRLYISSRTVQTHLAHIFAKLDLGSRAALATEVARHETGAAAR